MELHRRNESQGERVIAFAEERLKSNVHTQRKCGDLSTEQMARYGEVGGM